MYTEKPSQIQNIFRTESPTLFHNSEDSCQVVSPVAHHTTALIIFIGWLAYKILAGFNVYLCIIT